MQIPLARSDNDIITRRKPVEAAAEIIHRSDVSKDKCAKDLQRNIHDNSVGAGNSEIFKISTVRSFRANNKKERIYVT